MFFDMIIKKCGFDDEECICITTYEDNLVVIPCEDCMSGYYPDFSRSKKLVLNIEGLFFDNKFNDGEFRIDGILLQKEYDKYRVSFVEQTWDGFQIVND